MSDYYLPLFFDRMILVVEDPRQRIGKDRESLFERDTMLGKVGCCFPPVPFELKTHAILTTLPQLQQLSNGTALPSDQVQPPPPKFTSTRRWRFSPSRGTHR